MIFEAPSREAHFSTNPPTYSSFCGPQIWALLRPYISQPDRKFLLSSRLPKACLRWQGKPKSRFRHPYHMMTWKHQTVNSPAKRTVTLILYSMQVHPSGKVCIFFTNGDVKNTHTDGRVEYYYAEVATWHTTYADGVEVFYFPNGQVGGVEFQFC
jgi:hypothetical protein